MIYYAIVVVLKKLRHRGLALIYVLLITIPLVMILSAALSLVGHGTFTSLTYQDRMEAFYAAEAGVVYALEQLEQQTATSPWTPNNLVVDMPNGRGRFEISFGPSVNNLGASASADGPRGPGTVPADSVDLIVTGRAGAAERTIEAIIQRSGSIRIDDAIVAAGKVDLEGDIQIQGIQDIDDWTLLEAGVHSNYDVDEPDVVTWDGASISAVDGISGNITTVSENPGAINVAGLGTVGGDLLTGEEQRPLKKYDVETKIDNHSGAPVPPAPDATGTVTLTNGDFYVGSDYLLNGQIKLENANLYVKGDLQVTGSISGLGSVYVSQNTTFRGTATLINPDPDMDQDSEVGVGLFSKGNVELSGYNGEQYMEELIATLPPGDDVVRSWNDSKRALDEMSALLDANGWDGLDSQEKAQFDSYRRVLGQEESLGGAIPPWASGRERLRILRDALQTEPPSNTRNFLIDKFGELADYYDAAASFYPGSGMSIKEQAVLDFLTTGTTKGILDSSLDIKYGGGPPHLAIAFRSAAAGVQRLQFDGLGESYFQGVVYSEGYVKASSHVTVVGGILVNGERGPGSGLQPGDVKIENGATVCFPVDLFKSGRGVGGTGQLGVRSWISK